MKPFPADPESFGLAQDGVVIAPGRHIGLTVKWKLYAQPDRPAPLNTYGWNLTISGLAADGKGLPDMAIPGLAAPAEKDGGRNFNNGK
jgi:hypothetical protein